MQIVIRSLLSYMLVSAPTVGQHVAKTYLGMSAVWCVVGHAVEIIPAVHRLPVLQIRYVERLLECRHAQEALMDGFVFVQDPVMTLGADVERHATGEIKAAPVMTSYLVFVEVSALQDALQVKRST